MGLRALVADDHPAARHRLVALLEGRPGFDRVEVCADGDEALESLSRHGPFDVVFLDVEMPARTGLELAAELGAEAPTLVFVTAHDAHAVAAFELGAVDYLLKPFDEQRFEKTLERVLRRRREGGTPVVEPLPSAQEPAEGRLLRRIAVEKRGLTHLVPLSAVESIHAEGNYLRLHAQGESYLLRSSMTSLLGRLDPRRFVRTQRSVIVNLDHVREIGRGPGSELRVLLRSGRSVPVSRRHRRKLPPLVG